MKLQSVLTRLKAYAFTSLVNPVVTAIFFFSFLLILTPSNGHAQAYIEQSRYIGGNSTDDAIGKVVVVNGCKYIMGATTGTPGSNTYPVTTGGTNPGNDDIVLTKLNPDGTIAWSRFIGSSSVDQPYNFIESNGYIYIVGQTNGSNFPVTDGSSFSGTSGTTYNGFLVKLNGATGAIEFSTLLGRGRVNDVQYYSGSIYIAGGDASAGFTKTFVSRYDAVTNVLVYKKSFGGNDTSNFPIPQQSGRSAFKIVNGIIYLITTTFATDFPVTDASTHTSPGGGIALVLMKLDAVTGATNLSTYIGSTYYWFDFLELQVNNGDVYLLGDAYDSKLVSTTDGSKYNDDFAGINPSVFLTKWNSSNNVVYSKIISTSLNQIGGYAMEVNNGVVYIAGDAFSLSVPGTTLEDRGSGDLFAVKLDAGTGNLLYATFLGDAIGNEYFSDMDVVNSEMYITGRAAGGGYPVTNGSVYVGFGQDVFTRISANNTICYSTYLGGSVSQAPSSIKVVADSVFIAGNAFGGSFPVTDNSSWKGNSDITFTQFVFNPTIAPGSDISSPATQTACKNGIAQLITAPEISLASADMPIIYRNGVSEYQPAIICRYQWQVADAPGGPWTDIPGAVQKDYTPQVQTVNQYYRRLAYSSACASTPSSTSSVAEVLVSADTAPTVDAGGVFYTCNGTAVTLGGSPTATPAAGSTISTYLWEPAGAYTPGNAVANPSVSPTVSTIYTVTVTDDKGCKQAGQALVNVYKADAGFDMPTCANQVVRIGTAPIAGLTGVTYSWSASPADGTMSCTTCAQPEVHPLVATTYTLTVTLPVTGGGTCSTNDQVTITPVAAPTAGFGGADITICNTSTGSLGQPAQSGFSYTWAPGLYLNNVNIAQPTFTPGNISMPNPDPFTYYVTASKGGCSFTDEVKATAIEANAGSDGCGPRSIGTPDRTPGINETYSWVKLSGDGSIIGANNLPQVNVSATTSGTSVYELTVTYNGVTCTDQVSVPSCVCPIPTITVDAPFSCASYDVNGGNVTLTASSTISSTFTWSPAAGLSNTTGATVVLTDNVHRTYTVTATSTIDPGFFCSNTIEVNHPSMAKPVFTAQDVTVCPGEPVQIGEATVAGYSYQWTGTNLDNNAISNPTATVNSTTNFPVLVTDIGSGCTVRDTATVSIPGFPGNLAGADIDICGSAIVQLGSDPVPGLTYIWTPAASYDPNNTVANPKVFVAATTTFHVTATNTVSGCTLDDDITVTVKPAAPAFSFTNQTYCPSTAGALPLPAGPAAMSAYSWSPANQVINPTSNGPTATTTNPPPASATTYTLTITNADGCKSAADVTFTPSIDKPVAGSSRTACIGTEVQLGASPGMVGTYSWTVSPSPVSATYTLSSAAISNPVFAPTSVGTFTITVSYTEGGCTTTDVVVINAMEYSMDPTTSPIVCENSCVQIGLLQPDPGATYTWSPAAGLSDSHISNPIACVTTSDAIYRLTAVGPNGCVATRNVIVGVNPQQSPSISIPPVSGCYGGGSATFFPNVTPASSYNYVWWPNDGTISDRYAKNATVYITQIGAKKYTLYVTDQTTGCNGNAQGTLNVGYCALPVKLISFTAKQHSGNVLLDWRVAEETDLAYYVVEHSTNGNDFKAVGTKAATNSGQYQLLHTNPASGVNYYRLKMVDMDGTTTYSEVRKITISNAANVRLYPNPANNIVHISFPAEMLNKKASIIVISADGRIVLKKQVQTLKQTESIATESFTKGQYFIRVTTENAIVNKPVIIVR